MNAPQSDPRFVAVAPLDGLPEGTSAQFTVEGQAILLCHTESGLFAVDGHCSHAHEALAGGVMRQCWIACPAHGARFDLATGEPLNPPATQAIRTFPVRVFDGMIEVAPDQIG